MVLNRLWKGHLYAVEAEARKQSVALLDLNWEHGCGRLRYFAALGMSGSDCESATSIGFGFSE